MQRTVCPRCGAPPSVFDQETCSYCGTPLPRAVSPGPERPPSVARQIEELERDPRYATLLAVPAARERRRSPFAWIVPATMLAIAAIAFFGPGGPFTGAVIAMLAAGLLVTFDLVRRARGPRAAPELFPAVVVARQAVERFGEDETLVRSLHTLDLEEKDARRRTVRTDRRLYHMLADGAVGVARVENGRLVEFRRLGG
jgi:hypothetical protein